MKRGAFINTGKANCSIYESGNMVFGCIGNSDQYLLDYFSLDQIDLEYLAAAGAVRLTSAADVSATQPADNYDFWVFNWHFVTMAMHLEPSVIARLAGPKFTIVLELAPGDPLQLVPPGVFDGFIALDPDTPQRKGIYPFARPLQGSPRQPSFRQRDVPIISSFGFGTPGKGFESLVRAVNAEFDQAIIRINVPHGDYVAGTYVIHRADYPAHIKQICERLAKPGIRLEFSNAFMTPEQLVDWCEDSDLNCFMYTRCQAGLSATTDQAIISGRPLITSLNDTFRHIHKYITPYPQTSLREAMRNTTQAVHQMQKDWSKERFAAQFAHMLRDFGVIGTAGQLIPLRATSFQPVTIAVLCSEKCVNDVADRPRRIANVLGRTGRYVAHCVAASDDEDVRVRLEQVAPDIVLFIEGSDAQFHAGRDFAQQGHLLFAAAEGSFACNDHPPVVISIDAVIPYFTVATGLGEDRAIWLFGFAHDATTLAAAAGKIASERPGAVIKVHAFADDLPAARSVIENVSASGLAASLELVLLPPSGEAIINELATGEIHVFNNDGVHEPALRNLAELAMITERAVVFSRGQNFPVFGTSVTVFEDHTVPALVAMGLGAQIELLHQFDEGHVFSRLDAILSAHLGQAKTNRRSPAAAPGGDDGRAFLHEAYWRYLGRAPDPVGMEHYLRRLEDGTSRRRILRDLRGSAEAKQFRRLNRQQGREGLSGGHVNNILRLDEEMFVNQAYLSLLGRSVDDAGRRHHLHLMRNGETKEAILTGLAMSPEGRAAAKSVPGLDGLINRHLAAQRGLRGWLGGKRRKRHAMLHRALNAAEHRLNVLSAEIDMLRQAPPAAQASRSEAAMAAPLLVSAPVSTGPRDALVKRAPVMVTAAREAGATLYVLLARADGVALPDAAYGWELANGLVDAGCNVRAVMWDGHSKRLRFVNQAQIPLADEIDGYRIRIPEHPIDDDLQIVLDKPSIKAGDWLLAPGPIRTVIDQGVFIETDVVLEARRLNLANVFVVHHHTLAPLSSSEPISAVAANSVAQFAQSLLLADTVIATTLPTQKLLEQFFAGYQMADFAPPLVTMPLPGKRDGANVSQLLNRNTHARAIAGVLSAWHSRVPVPSPLFLLGASAESDVTAIGAIDVLQQALRANDTAAGQADWGRGRLTLHSAESSAAKADQTRAEAKLPGCHPWLVVDAGAHVTDLTALVDAAHHQHARVALILPATGFDAGEVARRAGEKWLKGLARIDKIVCASQSQADAIWLAILGTRLRFIDAEHRIVVLPGPDLRQPIGFSAEGRATVAKILFDGRHLSRADLTRAARVMNAFALENPQAGLTLLAAAARPKQRPGEAPLALSWQSIKAGETNSELLCGHDLVIVPVSGSLGIVPAWPASQEVFPFDMDRYSDVAPDFEDALRETIINASAPIMLRARQQLLDAPSGTTPVAYARRLCQILAEDRRDWAVEPLTACHEAHALSVMPKLGPRPTLSLCISTYNRSKWLGANLENIFRQIGDPRDDLEIVVVDNTSTDDTPQVCQAFAHRPDFRFYRNPVNVGMLGNLAVTAQQAAGHFVWIIGDDDLTRNGAIQNILDIIHRYPDLALIYMNYGYTSEPTPESIVNVDHFLDEYNVLQPPCPDEMGTVSSIAAKTENFYTAIYSHVYKRDHAVRSYCQDTSGRIFATMRACVPTTYYVLNYMPDAKAYWVGEPSLVVNSNVSWADYGALLDLEHLPAAWDLAERVGCKPNLVDTRRANRLWLVEMMWRDIYENDRVGNSAYFSARRVIMRLRHLPEFAQYVPEFRRIYETARAAGHPAAQLSPDLLFSAFASGGTGSAETGAVTG